MPIVRAGRALSVDLGDHVVKRLTRHDVETADLVLTATREHRAEVVRMLPQAASRVFTLKEFARVGVELDADDVAANAEDDPLRSLVGSASLLRGSASRPATPDRDDVPDPFGRHRSVHRRAAAEIDAATRSIEAIFSGAVSAACHRPGPGRPPDALSSSPLRS